MNTEFNIFEKESFAKLLDALDEMALPFMEPEESLKGKLSDDYYMKNAIDERDEG